jgi:hypothetical protein
MKKLRRGLSHVFKATDRARHSSMNLLSQSREAEADLTSSGVQDQTGK